MSNEREQKLGTSCTKFYSKYHRGRKCSDCALCGLAVSNVTHFETWGAAEQNFICKHLGKELPSSSCICKAHHAEAKRHCTQNGYIPKWKKTTDPVGSAEKILVCSHPCKWNRRHTVEHKQENLWKYLCYDKDNTGLQSVTTQHTIKPWYNKCDRLWENPA